MGKRELQLHNLKPIGSDRLTSSNSLSQENFTMRPRMRRQKTEDRSARLTNRSRQRNFLGFLLLLPHFPLSLFFPTSPLLRPATAQTTQDRKAEAARLLKQDIQLVSAEVKSGQANNSSQRENLFNLMRQAVEQQQSGKFEAAIQTWQQVLQLSRSTNNLPPFLEEVALEQLGASYLYLSNYGKAIEYQEQRLTLARKRQNLIGEGRSLSILGAAYLYLGNYDKAISYYNQYLAIIQYLEKRLREGTAVGDLGLDYPQGKGIALSNLGLAYQALGNYAKAVEYFEQSVGSTRSRKDQPGEQAMLVSLGDVHLALSNFNRAIEYYEQSLELARKLKDASSEGVALGKLGVAHLYTGNNAKATTYQEQSLSTLRERQDRRNEGIILGLLGRAYSDLNNYGKAIALMQRELAIVQELKDRQREGITLHNLGVAFAGAKNMQASEEAFFRSIEVLEDIRQRGVGNNDANRISIFETQIQTYRILQRVLVAQNKYDVALEVSERGRSRAFVELLGQRLVNQFSISPPKKQQMQRIAKQQNATLVQYSILENQVNVQGKRDLRPSELYVWVIQPTGSIKFRQVDLKPLWQQQNSSLEALVEQSRDTIGARGRADVEVTLSPEFLKQQQEKQTRNLKQLHELLIQPIADLLPQDPNQRVIFIPQGELFLVPFPALLDVNGNALIEQHTILTAPSIQVLELTHQQRQAIQNSKSKVQNALVVGNPKMPKVVTQVGSEPVQLSALPGAQREALTIAKLFNTQAITGAQATESAIAQQMPNARIIHFATHGLLDDTKGLGVPGAIALAPAGTGELNDGLLTADEILAMKLNAELVVLSACDTGRGRITGDGVIGLSRSLIAAGVPSIVVSLWKVPDDSTAFLMTEFYQNLQKTPDNKAHALRQAMLTTKQRYPEPLNWAAFTLIGEAE